MSGGYGETDLYYCNRKGDKWGKPINMRSYTSESVSIPGRDFLGNKPDGDFKITITGEAFNMYGEWIPPYMLSFGNKPSTKKACGFG